MSTWSLRLAHRILGLVGIHSPSRQVFCLCRVREAVERGRCMSEGPSWYAVRGPREPHEWPELRRAARLLRRMIRRHWFVLLTEPKAPLSMAIQTAMLNPPQFDPPLRPIRSEKQRMYDEMRTLLDAGKIQIRPDVAAEWAKEFRVCTEEIS